MLKKKMKINLKLMLGILFLMTLLPIISAVTQPTQQFNKIFLSPFYSSTLDKDTPYYYTLNLNVPDGISEVVSALISFQIYATTSPQEYTLLVNGKVCNNPLFVATEKGLTYAMFDCSNVITHNGVYEISISSSKESGSAIGWVDLTYINNPLAEINIFGTEYQVGDVTTTFIQLISNDGVTPINNATCYVTYYYPDKSVWLNSVLMTYQTGSNGLYYYDNTAQSQVGVYMVEVLCKYLTEQYQFNSTGIRIINGTYLSGNNASIQESDNDRYAVRETGFPLSEGIIIADFKFDETSGTFAQDNSTYHNNGTYFGSPNLTITGTNNTAIYFDGLNDYVYLPPNSAYNVAQSEDIIICFGYNSYGGNDNDRALLDYRSLTTNNGYSVYTHDDEMRLKRDSINEGNDDLDSLTQFSDSNWHKLCAFFNGSEARWYVDGVLDNSEFSTQTGGWATDGEGMYLGAEDGTNRFVTDDGLDELCIVKGDSINLTYVVNNYQIGNCGALFTTNKTLKLEVTLSNIIIPNDTIEAHLLTEYRWDDNVENIEVYAYNYSGSAWVKMTNELTYTLFDVIVTSDFIGNFTDYISGNQMLIRYQDELNSLSGDTNIFLIDQIALLTNNYVSSPIVQIRGGGELHITERNFSNLNTLPQDIWEYEDRQLTEFNFDVVNETLIAEEVWDYNDTINPSILSQISSSIWSLFNNTYNFIDGITESVWSYVDRNLTYYEDTTNYSLVAEYVWTYGDRNLTFYQVNDISPEDIWNYMDRNLTFTQDVTNYSSVAEYVWLYVDRNLTTEEINNISAEEIWSYYNRSLTQDIPLEVWSYPNRNLTTDIPFEVWSYYNRTLTYYTLNLTDLINQVNEFDYDQPLTTYFNVSEYYQSPTLNVILYVEK